eukprot:1626442-Rhodomonas_salina.6
MKTCETISMQLRHLNDPFTYLDFRTKIYNAVEKDPDWRTLVEVQRDTRPPLTFVTIKNKGLVKWTQLHSGDISAMLVKTESKTTESVNVMTDS